QYFIKQPTLLQWNLTIEQQLAPSLVLSVAYVGTRGEHLWDNEEGNPCFPTSITNGVPSWLSSTPLKDCPVSPLNPSNLINGRLNGAFSNNNYQATNADSTYHGLQAVINKRFSRGLQFVGSYTY